MTETTDRYAAAGFQTDRIGFGAWPAVVVVDFQRGFTDPAFPLGGNPLVERAVSNAVPLLEAARAAGVPVLNCWVGSTSARDSLHWKIPVVREQFHHGHPCTEFDPRIYRPGYDVIFGKIGPSLFFQTPAISLLVKERVDTVIVIGCNTSGCVRATINDAFSYGFRVMVPECCVGDVDEGPHADNLRDVARRYADIVTLEETITYLQEVGAHVAGPKPAHTHNETGR